ncbi:MAG: hypothetical protein HC877_19510 [Thioploca sp.]|nr:hypothetical protein [Thioploca sp.]
MKWALTKAKHVLAALLRKGYTGYQALLGSKQKILLSFQHKFRFKGLTLAITRRWSIAKTVGYG